MVGIPAALGLMQLAANVANKATDIHSDMRKPTSLSGKIKETMISSTVLIDSSLADNDVIPGVLNHLHSFLVGLVTTAVKLDGAVTGSRTVSDHISSVKSMEDYTDIAEQIDIGTEDLINRVSRISSAVHDSPKFEYSKEVAISDDELLRDLHNGVYSDNRVTELHRMALRVERKRDEAEKRALDREANKTDRSLNKATSGVTVGDGEMKLAENLPFGKVIEITMTNPESKYQESLPITVRLLPKYVTSVTLARLLGNYGQGISLKQRWLMKKAGEISFFRDFVGEGDLGDKLASDLKRDGKGELANIIIKAHNKNKFRLLEHIKNAFKGTSHTSSNLANTIVIVTEETIERAKAEGAGSLDDAGVRQKLFDKSYMLALLVVDTRYDRIKLYINSISESAEYPFSTFNPKKGMNSNDMLKLMSGLAAGRASVF